MPSLKPLSAALLCLSGISLAHAQAGDPDMQAMALRQQELERQIREQAERIDALERMLKLAPSAVVPPPAVLQPAAPAPELPVLAAAHAADPDDPFHTAVTRALEELHAARRVLRA